MTERMKITLQKWQRHLINNAQETYNEYKKQRESKNETQEDFSKKMKQDSKSNQKLFYKVLKTHKITR